MYCESKIDHSDFAHVEHIKPKAEDKFPELAYEWSNLGYCCARCNNNKSDNYHRDTPYIDPYSDDPSVDLIFYGAIVHQKRGSERGELTIQDIGLNRAELIEKRNTRINTFEKSVNSAHRTSNAALRKCAIDALKGEALPDKEYSLCIDTFLKLQE